MDIFTGEGMDEASEVHESTKSTNFDAWVEKYRGETLDDIILPETIERMVRTALAENSFGNYILYSGSPGTGKTSLARAIPSMLGTQHLFLFGKRDQEIIDEIEQYSRWKILDGKPRFVVIDEADHPCKPADFYRDLQSLIEATSSTLRFILTCNDLWRIPAPIQSRCLPIDFSYSGGDSTLKNRIFKRLIGIAEREVAAGGHEFDKGAAKKTITDIITSCYPDIREMINVMHRCYLENGGEIKGVPHIIKESTAEDIWKMICAQQVNELRYYISLNVSNCNTLYVPVGRYIASVLPDQAQIDFCTVLAECHYRAQSQVDPEIMFMGFACRIMRLAAKYGLGVAGV